MSPPKAAGAAQVRQIIDDAPEMTPRDAWYGGLDLRHDGL
jgi:hypothetical protein